MRNESGRRIVTCMRRGCVRCGGAASRRGNRKLLVVELLNPKIGAVVALPADAGTGTNSPDGFDGNVTNPLLNALKFERLNTLKPSTMNCRLVRSETLTLRVTRRSNL